jgi:hypothetical protein
VGHQSFLGYLFGTDRPRKIDPGDSSDGGQVHGDERRTPPSRRWPLLSVSRTFARATQCNLHIGIIERAVWISILIWVRS